jgi:hypothetical protein
MNRKSRSIAVHSRARRSGPAGGAGASAVGGVLAALFLAGCVPRAPEPTPLPEATGLSVARIASALDEMGWSVGALRIVQLPDGEAFAVVAPDPNRDGAVGEVTVIRIEGGLPLEDEVTYCDPFAAADEDGYASGYERFSPSWDAAVEPAELRFVGRGAWGGPTEADLLVEIGTDVTEDMSGDYGGETDVQSVRSIGRCAFRFEPDPDYGRVLLLVHAWVVESHQESSYGGVRAERFLRQTPSPVPGRDDRFDVTTEFRATECPARARGPGDCYRFERTVTRRWRRDDYGDYYSMGSGEVYGDVGYEDSAPYGSRGGGAVSLPRIDAPYGDQEPVEYRIDGGYGEECADDGYEGYGGDEGGDDGYEGYGGDEGGDDEESEVGE